MKTALSPLIKKGVLALLLSLSLLSVPVFAQENDQPDLIQAGLDLLMLDDFRAREMLRAHMVVGDEWMEMEMSLDVNAVERFHKVEGLKYDHSATAQLEMTMDLIENESHDPFNQSVPVNAPEIKSLYLGVDVRATMDAVAKGDMLYFQLRNVSFDYELPAGDEHMKEDEDLEAFKQFIDSLTDQWYKLDTTELEGSIFAELYWELFGFPSDGFSESDFEVLVKNHVNEILAGNKGWKQGLKDMLDEMMTMTYPDYAQDDFEQDRIRFLGAIDEILDTEFFVKKRINIGDFEGDTHFTFSKFALVGLFRNLGAILDEPIYQEDVEALKAFIQDLFMMGRYSVDENGVLDYMVVFFKLKFEALKDLTVTYGYKVLAPGVPNQIVAPSGAKGVEELERLFDEFFGYDYVEEAYYDNYNYCSIRSPLGTPEQHFRFYYLDCSNHDVLAPSLELYLNNENQTITSISDPNSFDYYFKCVHEINDIIDCSQVEMAEHDEVYDYESDQLDEVTIDCYANENDVYECESTPTFSAIDDFDSDEYYEYCFIKTYNNKQYLDCSSGQKNMLKRSLEVYLGESISDSEFDLTLIEGGESYFICENAACEEVSRDEHDEVFDFNYSDERVYDCYETEAMSDTDTVDDQAEIGFECEQDTEYDFTEVCYIQDVDGKEYVDCSAPPSSLVESALEAHEGKNLNVTVNHVEGFWYYYICDNSTCDEVSEDTFYSRDESMESELERIYVCTREGTEYECIEEEAVG